jgi:hypothetical protein
MAKMAARKKPDTSIRVNLLAKKYTKALAKHIQSEEERLKLALQLYEIAIQVEHAELHIHEHRGDRQKATRKNNEKKYKLSDPRAALFLMQRWCNIPVPAPLLACNKAGCAQFTRPAGFMFGCVLIGCWKNTCTGALMCVYLCL